MRRLVVALDYGTSNSGAAYAVVDDEDDDKRSDDIEVVKDWPRAEVGRDNSDKVPSESAYDKGGRLIGHGFEASRHAAAPLQWVKLLLEPDSFKEQSKRTSRVWHSYYVVGSPELPKRPVDVVGEYLRWLWRTVRDTIRDKESEDEDSDLFAPENLTVVLTVPASWSAPAKQRMATAAILVGIPEQCLKLLAEPEAAAVYGLQKKARQRAIADGDCVIICDAGGGTVDAVAYQVRTRSPLSLDQITVSKGDFCGSSFVNKEFKNQLLSILGDKYHALTEQAKNKIDETFEREIKRAYNPFEDFGDVPHYIPVDGLEDDAELGIRNGRMLVEDSVIFAAFDSVMSEILTLIDGQKERLTTLGLLPKLKGLLVVGGFGKSAYLRARIKQEFSRKYDPKVWSADDSWTAVVRGAVACEASAIGRRPSLINSRLSGYNYGIPYADCGVRKVHWLVHKGQSVQSNMCTEPYALRIDDQDWLDHDTHCRIYVPIVVSADDNPSDDYTDRVTPQAEIACRVPTDLRFSPSAKEIQASPKAWHIPAKLVLYFDGALISFRCRIGDREVGVAEVTYFQNHDGCLTEQDLRSDLEPSLVSAAEQTGEKEVVRADSFRSDSTVDSGVVSPQAMDAIKKRNPSAPAALGLDKETASSSHLPASPSSTTVATQKEKQKRRFWGIRTGRDTPTSPRRDSHHRPFFMAPNPLMDPGLSMEDRLNGSHVRWNSARYYVEKRKEEIEAEGSSP